ncbi:MAG: hypothetical protein Q7T86_10290 [Hyphomicrobiaceae bacterium]|jgi:hypothetical protein|nr:hypothetical protein [Hyphomicrobiaceae bacterium]
MSSTSSTFSKTFMPVFAIALAFAVLGCDIVLSAAATSAQHAQLQHREAVGP